MLGRGEVKRIARFAAFVYFVLTWDRTPVLSRGQNRSSIPQSYLMRNLKLTLSYDGTDFFGWQTQPGKRTVQETLEAAIATLTGEERIRVNAAGRTDSGVHALGQVANFFSQTKLPADKLVAAINAHLPDDVAALEAE